ncbi:hypothetical protein Hanom_Chr15g01373611 [Helianthus anomalus]
MFEKHRRCLVKLIKISLTCAISFIVIFIAFASTLYTLVNFLLRFSCLSFSFLF